MGETEESLRIERDKLAEACEVLLTIIQEKQIRIGQITDALRSKTNQKWELGPMGANTNAN